MLDKKLEAEMIEKIPVAAITDDNDMIDSFITDEDIAKAREEIAAEEELMNDESEDQT